MNGLVGFFKWVFAACVQKDIIPVAIPEEPRIALMGEFGTGSQHNFQDGKSGILVDLIKIDMSNYYTSDWKLDDSTEPIQYGEYMIWFLLNRTYWFAVDIRNGVSHDFYAFDVRKIAQEVDMSMLGKEEDIIFYKRKWLTRFLKDLAKREYVLEFRNNDVD